MSAKPKTKLCLCSECQLSSDIDPETGEIVQGFFIPPSTWSRHRKRDSQEKPKNPSGPSDLMSGPSDTHARSTPFVPGDPEAPRVFAERPKTVSSSQSSQEDDVVSQDLLYYENILTIALSSFKTPHFLEFVSPPSADKPFLSPLTTTFPINLGPCTLKRGQLDNESLLHFEEWLCEMYQAVVSLEESGSPRPSLLPRILDGLRKIDNSKEISWNYQRKNPSTDRAVFNNNSRGLTISTARFMDVRFPSTPPQIIAFQSLILPALLHSSCHISRERCNFFVRLLSSVIRATLSLAGYSPAQSDKLLASIPSDVRTVQSILRLKPDLIRYVCCPNCRALYPHDESGPKASGPPYCTFRSVSQGPECHTPLYKNISESSGIHGAPRLVYSYQDFSQWLGKLLCRPGIEDTLRSPLKNLDKGNPLFIRSIWDGTVVRNLTGSDGNPFFRDLPGKLRLLFGFGYDNFNPFHNRQAGKKVSVGAMFLFLYNLPESIRLKVENICIIGVVHGPTQPELTELNHYMDLLITQFEIFFDSGFFYPVTPDSPDGILVQGCLFPLILDLHALRQVTGTGSHRSKHFCLYCLLPLQCIHSTDPTKWPKWYTPTEHRRLADMWLHAPTEDSRQRIFQENYVRYSPLLRLPYFQVDLMSSIEPMHAFQNISRNLIRNTWGIDHQSTSGDGQFVGTRPKGSNSITQKEIINAYNALSFKDYAKLNNARKPVLYHMCEIHNLYRVATAAVLRKSLIEFYTNAPEQLKIDLQQAEATATSNSNSDHSNSTTGKLRQRLEKITPETREEVIAWLSEKPLPDLEALCLERNIQPEKRQRKLLAEVLVKQQLQNPPPFPSIHLTRGRAVIGKDLIAELNKDMTRTALPSWTATGPKEFDMSQHGKQSAAEWRTTVLVRLVVTLPRIWGPRGGRAIQMLDNFMHLTNAMVVASTRAVLPSTPKQMGTAGLYRREYLAYLRGRVELYPTGIITPTEHLGYHIADKLESIGPIHIQSANAFERFNGMLQDIPSNMRMGELETTLMTNFCTSANLRALLNHPDIPVSLHSFRDSFNETFGIEGGAMIQDVLPYEESRFFYPNREDLRSTQVVTLDPAVEKLVTTYLNTRYKTEIYSIGFGAGSCIWSIDKAQSRGIWYHGSGKSKLEKSKTKVFHRDSHILIKSRTPGKLRPVPYVMKQLFALEYEPPRSNALKLGIFFIASRYLPLSREDSMHDWWRKYPISGGRLYYDKLDKERQIFMLDDLVGHFAVTPFEAGDLPGIKQSCIHVLPLFWHKMFDWLEYLNNADEEDAD